MRKGCLTTPTFRSDGHPDADNSTLTPILLPTVPCLRPPWTNCSHRSVQSSFFLLVHLISPNALNFSRMASSSGSHPHSAPPTSSRFSREPSGSSDSKNMLVLIPDRIDVEEEARFYDDIVDVSVSILPAAGGVEAAVILTGDPRDFDRARALLGGKITTPTDSRTRLPARPSRGGRSSRTTSGWETTAGRATLSRGLWRSLDGRALGISGAVHMSVR